jgi:hypothetical protein
MTGRALIHASHHKCGTRWVHSVCNEICKLTGRKWTVVSNPSQFNYKLSEFFSEHRLDFVSDVNAEYSHLKNMKQDFLAFHVIRDPRDIVISSYFSSLKTHSFENWPELQAHRQKLNDLSKEQGILLEMEFISDVFRSLNNWSYQDSRILEVKMESLMKNNYLGFLEIFKHLNLLDEYDQSTSSIAVQTRNQVNLLRNRLAERNVLLKWTASYPEKIPLLNLLGIVHRNGFSVKTGGRKPGKEDQSSHYRKGIAGDWRNHFTPEIEKEFKAKYGDLTVKMGYESDTNWGIEAGR